jgi:flagellar assembly protein FliH
LEWIREALELAAGSPAIKLHLNPADHATLVEPLQCMLANRGESAEVEILADPDTEPGGCLVETAHGSIDQRLETQLSRIEDELV